MTWRSGPPKNMASRLGEHDHDLLDLAILPEAMAHARKLCGLAPYSMREVKPAVSAGYIFKLAAVIGRLLACKGITRYRELCGENAELAHELARCHREMARWGLEYPGSIPARVVFKGRAPIHLEGGKETELDARLDAGT